MGICFDKADRHLLQQPSEDKALVPWRGTGGQVRCLILALDYKYSPGHELTSSLDGSLMVRMAKHAECSDLTTVTDQNLGGSNFPVRRFVLERIQEVGSRCQPGDWFVWFWAGHGVNVPDARGATAGSGQDQAFVTPDAKGRLTEPAVFLDHDFAKAIDTFIPLGVRVLCICDCCHSGTICDIDSFAYRHEIYQVSASQDDEEAEDTGRGGVLTWALKRTLIKLGFRHVRKEFSLQRVFDGCKKRVGRITNEQQVSVQYSGTPPDQVAWPLCFPIWKWAEKVPDDLVDHEQSPHDIDVLSPSAGE